MEQDIVETSATPTLVYGGQPESPWFDFVASVAGSLAWPLVVVAAIWLFRPQFLAAIGNLRTLKVGGAELGFDAGIKTVTETSKGIESPDRDIAEANDERLAELINMAAVSPTGAIVEAWKDVDSAARLLVERGMFLMPQSELSNVHSDVKRSNALTTSRLLRKYGLLPPTELATFEELRDLRNRAAHESDQDITVDQARQYVRISDKLVDVIQGLAADLE